jgi:hypothetical protein
MATVAEIFKTMEYGPAPESDKEALGWLGKHERVFGHFIDGAWTDPGRTFDVINPSTSKTIARVTDGTKADVDAAVSAARRALPAWKGLTPHARARHLYALARAVQKHSRLLAVLESMDNGKSIRETRDIDIPLVARHFYHHAGWAQLLGSEFEGYEAIGVVGQIIPWNFPLLMLAWKIAPALAAGNTVVLKPAEFTPLTALAFAEIADAAGIPAGVINIVTGHGETGAAIVEHPDVDKIAFTGSTEVGKIIRRSTAGSGKKLSLELGGKSPFIVYDDADLDSVVEGVVDAIWFNQGQVCCAGSRLLVQEGVADRLLAKLRARMEKASPRLAARQGSGHGRHRRAGATRAHSHARAARCRRRRDDVAAVVGLSDGRLLLSAHVVHRRAAVVDDRPGRDLRSGARVDDLPYARRIRRAGEQHALRSRGECVDRKHQSRPGHRAEDQGGRGVGELDEPLRRRRGFWRLSRERVWTGGRKGRDVGVCETPGLRSQVPGLRENTAVSPETRDQGPETNVVRRDA